MNKNELEKYRGELLAEKQVKIDAVNRQYQRKLDALSVLIEETPEQLVLESAPSPRRAKSIFHAVREAIEKAPSGFSTRTLFSQIKQTYPNLVEKPSDLSNSLWVLRKDHEITVIEEGVGKEPSTYKITNTFRSANTRNGA